MRFVLVIAAAWAAVLPAYADEACDGGVSKAIEVISWSASEGPGSFAPTIIDLTLRNNLAKNIRMLDASIFYADVLGRDIGRYGLDPDTKAPADAEFTQQGTYFTDERLINANPDDIVVTVCTRKVVYDDGTVERFDQ